MTNKKFRALGVPLNTLVGCCLATELLTADSDLVGFSMLLVKRAKELESAWEELNTENKGGRR